MAIRSYRVKGQWSSFSGDNSSGGFVVSMGGENKADLLPTGKSLQGRRKFDGGRGKANERVAFTLNGESRRESPIGESARIGSDDGGRRKPFASFTAGGKAEEEIVKKKTTTIPTWSASVDFANSGKWVQLVSNCGNGSNERDFSPRVSSQAKSGKEHHQQNKEGEIEVEEEENHHQQEQQSKVEGVSRILISMAGASSVAQAASDRPEPPTKDDSNSERDSANNRDVSGKVEQHHPQQQPQQQPHQVRPQKCYRYRSLLLLLTIVSSGGQKRIFAQRLASCHKNHYGLNKPPTYFMSFLCRSFQIPPHEQQHQPSMQLAYSGNNGETNNSNNHTENNNDEDDVTALENGDDEEQLSVVTRRFHLRRQSQSGGYGRHPQTYSFDWSQPQPPQPQPHFDQALEATDYTSHAACLDYTHRQQQPQVEDYVRQYSPPQARSGAHGWPVAATAAPPSNWIEPHPLSFSTDPRTYQPAKWLQQQQQQHLVDPPPRSDSVLSGGSGSGNDLHHLRHHHTLNGRKKFPLSTNPDTSEIIADETLASLTVKELNKRVQNLPREKVVELKQRRRTLKNRG